MGSDGGYAEGSGGVAPLGGSVDLRYFGLASWLGDMGVAIYDGGLGDTGAVANEGVHLEAEGYHCGIYCKLTHL